MNIDPSLTLARGAMGPSVPLEVLTPLTAPDTGLVAPNRLGDQPAFTSLTCETPTRENAIVDATAQLEKPQDRIRLDHRHTTQKTRRFRSSRITATKTSPHAASRRFACPCQVLGYTDDCLRPSKRNPDGGATNVRRLKEHLERKHMMSNRCPICSISIDKNTINNHTCGRTQKGMFLLTKEQEGEMNELRFPSGLNTPTEDAEKAWWRLLEVVCPTLKEFDKKRLAKHISPYFSLDGSKITIGKLLQTLQDENKNISWDSELLGSTNWNNLPVDDQYSHPAGWDAQMNIIPTLPCGGSEVYNVGMSHQQPLAPAAISAASTVNIPTHQTSQQDAPYPCFFCRGTGRSPPSQGGVLDRLQRLEEECTQLRNMHLGEVTVTENMSFPF